MLQPDHPVVQGPTDPARLVFETGRPGGVGFGEHDRPVVDGGSADGDVADLGLAHGVTDGVAGHGAEPNPV